jgi:hypothetical protein
VRHAAGELAYQPGVRGLVHLQFQLTSLRDVFGDARQARHDARLVLHRKRAVANPADLAVGTTDAVLDLEACAVVRAERFLHLRAVLGHHAVEPLAGTRLQTFGGAAPHSGVRGTDVGEVGAAEIGEPEDFENGLGQLPEARVRVAQRPRGVDACRDVDDIRQQKPVAALAEHAEADFDHDARAVAAFSRQFAGGHCPVSAPFGEVGAQGRVARPEFLGHQLFDLQTHHAPVLEAEEFLGVRVGEHDAAREVDEQHPGGRHVHDQAVTMRHSALPA